MTVSRKDAIKDLLGELPFTAELYWLLRQRGKPIQSRFLLKSLENAMPGLAADAQSYAKSAPEGKNIFIFATLHYWIEHAAVLGMALAGMGHHVRMGYLPFSDWQKPVNRFDLRRQNIYARRVLEGAGSLLDVVPMMNGYHRDSSLPEEMTGEVRHVTDYDTQYTLQVEDVDPQSEIYQLRLRRNTAAAIAALQELKSHRPDVVIVPNGTIQELGIVYRTARHLKIPVVTYEFGDQRDHMWLAQNAQIMRQDTSALWAARQNEPLTEEQMERMHGLFAARQRGALWENFARKWQDVAVQGGDKARAALGLDSRPVVLLATNVLGDSLTLGRQVFSHSMAEWIVRSVQYFAGRPDVQLVIRVHPGEVLTHGPSMVDVIHEVLPELPEYIRVIGPREKVNTYDLIDVADLGLVYTTTVGMEMAMNGLPVIVTGKTHYRGRGFTYDPDSWVTYFKQLGQILSKPMSYRLSRSQVEHAWAYAYRFFFEYPRPFPWHLVRMWDDVKTHPMREVLSPEGQAKYGETFRYLTGEPLDWSKISE